MSKSLASILAVLAAVLYVISIPFSKILLEHIEPIFMAGFLYLGAGIGVSILYFLKKDKSADTKLTRQELPYTIGMIVLDTLAPIFLMIGLLTASPSSASLLNNFEIVATSVIALVIFKEKISPMLSIAIFLIVCASILLSVGSFDGIDFQIGSIFIILACICWGFENNCTRVLSSKSTHQIVILKGIFSGLGSIITAFLLKETISSLKWVLLALILGFISYGLSIFVYIKAQSVLGASKTCAYYSLSPFIGVFLSQLIFGITPNSNFLVACMIMILATIIIVIDTLDIKMKLFIHKNVT